MEPHPAYDLTFSPSILQRGMTIASEVRPSVCVAGNR